MTTGRAYRRRKVRHAEPPAEAVTRGFAIKVAAPRREPFRWGDLHFGNALAAAIRRAGHRARVDLREDWYARPDPADDVVIVLRGPLAYVPRPDAINIMWNISHPDQVDFEEYEAYDLSFVAGEGHAAFLATFLDAPVGSLLQATDAHLFRPDPPDPDRQGVVFVGNARDEPRDMVRRAIGEGIEVALYGANWERFADRRFIRADYLDNHRLPALYRSAVAVLNDHTPAMREFGFLSNRVFDVLAAGGSLISDDLPAGARLGVGSARFLSDGAPLAPAVTAASGRRPSLAAARRVGRLHSFDRRAATILGAIARMERPATGNLARIQPATAASERPRPRVLAVVGSEGAVPDAAAFRRIISPLAHDAAGIELTVRTGLERAADAATFDVLLLQAGALVNSRQSPQLAGMVRDVAVPLVLDVGEAESDLRRGAAATRLREVAGQARQIWFEGPGSLHGLSGAAGSAHLLPTPVDQRLWRDFDQSARPPVDRWPLRFLWIVSRAGTPALNEMVFDALDQVARSNPGRFVVLAVPDARQRLPDRAWLRVVRPRVPDYPRFVRWLRRQGPFDFGLGPAETGERRFLEYSALGMVSLLDAATGEASGAVEQLSLQVERRGDAWVAAITGIVENPSGQATLGRSARQFVWQLRRCGDAAAARSRLIRAAIKGRDAPMSERRPNYG